VLAQMCRFVPKGSLASFVVLNPHLSPVLFPDLDWIPTRIARKPSEAGFRGPKRNFVEKLISFGVETARRKIDVPRLIDEAYEFAVEQQIDAIWVVIQGQTIVRMAAPLAKRLGVPIYSQVWDPVSWWLSAHNVDSINSHKVEVQFDELLNKSEACAAASWAMAELYVEKYETKSTAVIASHDSGIAQPASITLRNDSELVIGMAGQFYAVEAWLQMINALNLARWQVNGRVVKLMVMGRDAPPGLIPRDNLLFMGWQSQLQTIELLSRNCDLLYCPYPFADDMVDVSRLSFPSKLSTYFAAGRPILFHGTRDSSPARYLDRFKAGFVCDDPYPAAIYNAVQTLVERPDLYRAYAIAASEAFFRDFTLKSMRSNFYEFLGQVGERLQYGPEVSTQLINTTEGYAVRVFRKLARKAYNILVPARVESKIARASSVYSTLAMERDSLGKSLASVEAEFKEKSVALSQATQLIEQKSNKVAILEDDLQLSRGRSAVQEERSVMLERELAELRYQSGDLQGRASAVQQANENLTALITGKLSLLEYNVTDLAKNAVNQGRAENTVSGNSSSVAARNLYLDLLESELVGTLHDDPSMAPWSKNKFDPALRQIGRDWPSRAQTMIGTVRMRNLRHLVERVINEGVQGDFIETGVWRGGACIYVRGIFASYGITDRTVWVADSFKGLPPPDEKGFPEDRGDQHFTVDELAISLDQVKSNFQRYGLLDAQVKFLEGWFKDTLPSAPIQKLAVLRLDGDMYESTIQALDALYDKVTIGGMIIVDDFVLPACRKAIEDFRNRYDITSRLEDVDGAAVYWRKSADESKAVDKIRMSSEVRSS
jgi:glycosyltransferase involved in cell wall biosynthesis